MLTTEVSAGWAKPRPASARAAVAGWEATQARDESGTAAWGEGRAVQQDAVASWAGVPTKELRTNLRWKPGKAQDIERASDFDAVPPRDQLLAGAWDHSIRPVDWSATVTYNPAPAVKDAAASPRYQRSDEQGPRWDAAAEVQRSLYLPGSGLLAFTFGGRHYSPSNVPSVFFDFRYAPPSRVIQPVDSGTGVRFRPARNVTLFHDLLWGRARTLDPLPSGIAYPDYEGPITIIIPDPDEPDILETYMIANSVSVVVLPARTPLDATAIRISRDIDSFAWTLQAQLFGRTSLAAVKPSAAGPKEIEVTINGHVWGFLVERYSGTGKLADERYTITGVSRTQLLAAPYAPKRSQVNIAPINAEQAAIFELEFTDFTLEWDVWGLGPPDWTMPAGAYSYQDQTPMEVIAGLAETVGAVVRPALTGDELAVVPRYRAPVWQWSASIMDRIIPAAIVGEWGSEWQPQPEWNSCYVSGTTHGVAVDVRRAGTAGDIPAADVYADWMTATDAGRARGITELCKGGNQEIVTLNIPLFPAITAPGLVEPAMLCEVRDIEDTWRGLCLGTEISAEGIGASRVKQTLRLERHHREGA